MSSPRAAVGAARLRLSITAALTGQPLQGSGTLLAQPLQASRTIAFLTFYRGEVTSTSISCIGKAPEHLGCLLTLSLALVREEGWLFS